MFKAAAAAAVAVAIAAGKLKCVKCVDAWERLRIALTRNESIERTRGSLRVGVRK